MAETEGIAAALKIARETGDVEIDPVEVSEAMQARIESRKIRETYCKNAIKGLK